MAWLLQQMFLGFSVGCTIFLNVISELSRYSQSSALKKKMNVHFAFTEHFTMKVSKITRSNIA